MAVFRNSILLFVLLFLFKSAFSQSSLNGNESMYDTDYFQIQHINDIDFLFDNYSTNDVAFTHSFLLKAFINQKELKNRMVSIGIRTDLFTERLGREFEPDRVFAIENFTEISSVELSVVKFLKNNFALQMAGGIGLLNKKKPIPGLALWLQGGSDGRGGFHKILDDLGKNHGQINVSRDYLSPFFYVNPAISRFFYVAARQNRSPHVFVTELGTNICTNFDALWLFWQSDLRVHLLQQRLFRNVSLRLDLLGQSDFKLHREGLKTETLYGAEIAIWKIAAGYEKTNQFGKDNLSWIDYTDTDNLYRIFLKIAI